MVQRANDKETLEVVYYAAPVPRNRHSLTFLGLVFDKIHFPNVYLPGDGFDPEAVKAEAERIASLGIRNHDDVITISVLKFLPIASKFRDICYFTGKKKDVFGNVDPGADKIVETLDLELNGPPPPNFVPMWPEGYTKGLPGGDESIHFPGTLHYPANSMIYAARHGIPLVNDAPGLPVPALGGQSTKNNAKLLSTILAMECASLVLPKIRSMNIDELSEARQELSKYLKPFRRSLLGLARELNHAIESSASHEDIMRAAKFVVETSVFPPLEELREALERPSKPWYNRTFDVVKQVPELATNFASMPMSMAIAKALASLGGILVDMQGEHAKKDGARSGMYYLLKLKDIGEMK